MGETGTKGPQETHKQRRLNDTLRSEGYPHGWRRYLLEQREAGMSRFAIALLLAREYDFPVDGSTIGKWLQQAEQESEALHRTRGKRAAEESGASSQ